MCCMRACSLQMGSSVHAALISLLEPLTADCVAYGDSVCGSCAGKEQQVQRIALRFKLDRYVSTQLKLHVNSLKSSDTSLKSILSACLQCSSAVDNSG